MRSRKRRYHSVLIVGLVSLVLTGGCGDSTTDADADTDAELRVPVVTQTTVARDVPFTVTTLGTVEAWKEVTVSARTSGEVLKLHFDKGDVVHPRPAAAEDLEGNTPTVLPLAELEQEEYKLRLAQAAASLSDATTTFERTERLFEQGSAVQSEYDKAKAAYDVAKAQYDLAEKLFNDTIVYSPIEGTVIARPVEVGELVVPGTPIATVADVHKVKIVTSVAESDSPHVALGAVCPVSIDALPGRAFTGRVIYKSIKADAMTRSFPIELEMENAGGALGIGMVARVTFTLRTERNAITVPIDALTYWEQAKGVFIVDTGGVASFRVLMLGARCGDEMIVTAGLEAGDEVVTSGQEGLRPGSTVVWAEGKPAHLSTPRLDAPGASRDEAEASRDETERQ
ncbi:MAG: efflux RND transporter periplasmic adaptor subunit [Verrucomicrobia bacterium]|nr:efflux RND transporter periplasmic adaptor subunit [Verrucomicrobiota bacterium]